MRASTVGTFTRLLVVLAVVTLLAGIASAQVNGAIYTTNSDGSTVNGNIYLSKDLVYVSGGPENKNDAGLSPGQGATPALYYFQVTNPSGVSLLSQDDIKCRVVVVVNGRVDGVPTDDGTSYGFPGAGTQSCYHQPGTKDDANGALPVQLCSYDSVNKVANCPGALPVTSLLSYYDTDNPGGEYKAWMTPVHDYDSANSGSCTRVGECWGFVDADSKTDNFKVKKAGAAYVTVCKFNDLNDNGLQDTGEPPIAHWPVTATGVDGDTGSGVTAFTDDQTGCVSFSVSSFPNGPQPVTLTEGTQGPDWSQTAPPNGACGTNCNVSGGTTYTGVNGDTVTKGGIISVTLSAGDNVTAPNFGNFNPFCTPDTADACAGGLEAVKDAFTSYKYTWGISKSVDKKSIKTSQTSTTVNYTVTVTNNGPTGWQATGTIKVANTSSSDITGVNVTDTVDNGGVCTINDAPNNGQNETIPAGTHISLPYSCTYAAAPSPTVGTNTATALWTGGSATGTHSVDFTAATVSDASVTVSDSLEGSLGTVSIDPSTGNITATSSNTNVTATPTSPTPSVPGVFTYPYTITGTAGTCTTVGNTATFTAVGDTSTTGTAMASVKDCVGADLTVSKTAATTFTRTYNWSINKSVDKTKVEQSGGSVTFNYTVVASETGFTDSAWTVGGTITVYNPNNWESITASVSDSLDTGSNCTYSPTSVTVPAATTSGPGSAQATYSCSLTPGAGGTNYATATWNNLTYFTPDGTATSSGVAFAFTTPTKLVNQTVTPTDSFNGGTGVNLCTLDKTDSPDPCTLTATDSTPYTTQTYHYSRTVTNSSPGTCTSYTNNAVIPGSSSSQKVTVCNTNTGALTMGFWQNKNGEGIIAASGSPTSGACYVGAWLRSGPTYVNPTLVGTGSTTIAAGAVASGPFGDLSATAACGKVGDTTSSTVVGYVYNIIKAANASGSSMNAMLKAQMLATALDVYFGGGPGGDPIHLYNGNVTVNIGQIEIDLTKVCSMIDSSSGTGTCSGSFINTSLYPVFGGATKLKVYEILTYAASQSNTGGSSWYGQNKTIQGYAKNTFDAINNQAAQIAP